MAKRANKYANWCFTLNNPTEAECADVRDWLRLERVKYVVYQHEVGGDDEENTGTPHLQGYVQMPNKGRLPAMKLLQPRAHWENRKGTHEEARAYCLKEYTRVRRGLEQGVATTGRGMRNDLHDYRDAIIAGITPAAMVMDDDHYKVMAKYPRLRQQIEMALNLDARTWMTELHIKWGITGSGKSHWARETYPGAFWLSPPRDKGCWWDGYRGQETVIIDEFKGWIPQARFKRLADKYPFQEETKGGMTPFMAKRIIVLSNHDPETWWSGGLEDAVRRRITSCQHMTMPYMSPAEEAAHYAAAAVGVADLYCDEELDEASVETEPYTLEDLEVQIANQQSDRGEAVQAQSWRYHHG